MTTYNRENIFNAIPPVTKSILIINSIVWLACFVFSYIGFDLAEFLGLHYFQASHFHFYQLITYMFTQKAFSHFFFNMFAVYMFGVTLEKVWGPKRFLIYYIITGLGAAFIQELVWYFSLNDLVNSGIPIKFDDGQIISANDYINLFVTIGASGAVFGVLLAFGMLFPNVPLYIMFIPIPIKAKYFVIGYGLVELFLGFANRSGDNVAHFAHLGGMLFGFFLILYWRKKDRKDGYHY